MAEIAKFLFRLAFHLATFFCVMLPLMVMGVFVLAIIIPFQWKGDYYLPKWAILWDNADGYIGRDSSVYRMICDMGKWPRYKWLAFRNPINFAGYKLFGMEWTPNCDYVRYNPAEEKVGDGTRPGFKYIEVEKWEGCCGVIRKKVYFEYYLIYQYPFAKRYCLRFRCGHKIGNKNNPPGSVSQWVLVLNFFQPYTGK